MWGDALPILGDRSVAPLFFVLLACSIPYIDGFSFS